METTNTAIPIPSGTYLITETISMNDPRCAEIIRAALAAGDMAARRGGDVA